MKCRSLLSLIAVVAVSVSLSADTVIEEIIARVNDSIITRSDLVKSREELQQELQQKGKDLGITGDTELVKRLDELRKQLKLDTLEDLEKEAQKQGVSFEDYKQGIRNQIITQQVIQHEVAPKIQITEKEVQDYYNQHKAELEQPEAVDLSEILVSTGSSNVNVDPNAPPPPEDPAKVAAAEEKAKQLLASIKAGAKFEDVAKKSSDGPTADQGGELG